MREKGLPSRRETCEEVCGSCGAPSDGDVCTSQPSEGLNGPLMSRRQCQDWRISSARTTPPGLKRAKHESELGAPSPTVPKYAPRPMPSGHQLKLLGRTKTSS